ncbi:MAG: hypothetical protein EU517_01385 [Promethearchaeota archaeon]|nr:MAG: hypothetical protein EU517_01385 [Candidatus Lokiarchaeota archaeon]
MRFKSLDLGFILSLAIISIVSIDLLFNEDHRDIIENISKFPPFQNIITAILITFIVTLIGNLIPFPTPYTFVLCYSSTPFIALNLGYPLLFALIASFGCLLGELGGYFFGRGTFEFISEEHQAKMERYHKFLVKRPKLTPVLIFLAALTPISDDFITVPLGMMKYSLRKTAFWCWLGKLGLMLLFSYNIFNVCILLGGESWFLSIISLYFIFTSMYILLKIDIVELLKKALKKPN